MSAGICFDTRKVSACRGLWSGFLKVPLENVWDQRRLKSMWGAFLHSCCYAAKQLPVFLDVIALTFTRKISMRGVQGLRQATNFETPRGMLCSWVPLFAFFIDKIFVARQKNETRLKYIFFKRHWRVFPKKACWLITRNTRTLWTDARVSSTSFVRSEITSGLWRVYIFNRKPAWELWSFWKWDNRRQRASIAHPTLIFFFFPRAARQHQNLVGVERLRRAEHCFGRTTCEMVSH